MTPLDDALQVYSYSPHHEAPEVASCQLPIYDSKGSEKPQVVDSQGPEVYSTIADVKENGINEKEAVKSTPATSKRMKRNLAIAIAVGILVLVVALGAGLGAGLEPKPTLINQDNQNISLGPSPVTSGSTGIAAYSCNNTGPYDIYTLSDGTKFREECRFTYREGYLSFDSMTNVEDVSKTTTYSFEECMNRCADMNSNINASNTTSTKCGAVTYNANLTFSIERWQVNCFLKNARGSPYTGTAGENYGLVASAYILQD